MTFNKGEYGDFLVSTTEALEGYEILQYFNAVSTRVVVGAGFMTEFFASFTDTFGGRSQSVEDNLHTLYSEAMAEMVKKARKLGANAIVGTKLDIDQISGKGTFMFMISAMGTPIYAVRKNGLPLYEEQVALEQAHEAALKAEEEAKAEQEKKEKAAQIAAYWEEHAEEKAQLDKQLRYALSFSTDDGCLQYMRRMYVDLPDKERAMVEEIINLPANQFRVELEKLFLSLG